MPAGVIKYIEGQRQFEIHFPRERVVIKVGYIGSDPTLLARPYQKEDGNRGTVVDAKEFPLQRQENKEVKLDWRVEAMKLIKVGTRSHKH